MWSSHGVYVGNSCGWYGTIDALPSPESGRSGRPEGADHNSKSHNWYGSMATLIASRVDSATGTMLPLPGSTRRCARS